MQDNIESRLLDKYPELYSSIKEKAVDELKLSVKVCDSAVYFGKILDFYMFWIIEKYGNVYFKARKKFVRSRRDNSVCIAFVDRNKNAILDAIDEIYNSYSESIGIVQSKKESVKKQEIPPEIMLLWDDVTTSVLEKAEMLSCDVNNIDENTVAQLKVYGKRTVELFDEILDIMEPHERRRRFPAYREYTASDKVTLADIAPKYAVSRERIRQYVKFIDGNIFARFKTQMLFDNEELNGRIRELADIFKEVDYNIIPLIAYGFDIGSRKRYAVFNMLFGKDACQLFVEKSLHMPIKEEIKQTEKAKKIDQKLDKYRSKICYPSGFVVNNSTSVVSYEKETEYDFEKRFYKKLKEIESITEIVKYPDIVYYSTSATDYRPSFLLRLDDGTSVLVLLLPTANMAYIYNIRRYNEMHRFCRDNGYGYLITDDRGNTVYDIKNRVVDPELVERLDTILKKQTMIVWRNIKEIKQTRAVSNADIAAYVLQNNLHFTMKPFCIKHRQEI